jgi:hypothetical protein
MENYRIFIRKNKSSEKEKTETVIKANSRKEAIHLAAGVYLGVWVSAKEEKNPLKLSGIVDNIELKKVILTLLFLITFFAVKGQTTANGENPFSEVSGKYVIAHVSRSGMGMGFKFKLQLITSEHGNVKPIIIREKFSSLTAIFEQLEESNFKYVEQIEALPEGGIPIYQFLFKKTSLKVN